MRNLLPDILLYGATWIIAVLGIAFVMGIHSQALLDRAYSRYIDTPVVRNEWGQQHRPPEWMCKATIKQWMEICNE